ncbi:ABC transporter permease [Phormidium tenue FACHB-886]|nr:ABC transporter permease [Phormidium tenue FACHB-886]
MNGTTAAKMQHYGSERNWENYRDLLLVLVQKELKVRYNNKLLGYLWSIANPLASALIYYIAFRLFMRVNIENYPVVLISGVFPWQWMTNAVGSAPNLFVGNSTIIKKVNFPKQIVPLSAGLNHMIHFIVSIPVIILFLYIFGQSPSISWLYGVPILLFIQFVMIYGLTLFLASINVFLRDLERLTNILLHFTFYVTPILYPLEHIPPRYRELLVFNPFGPLMVSWRELILNGKLEPLYLLIGLGYAMLFWAIGSLVYRKLVWKFAEVI